MNMSMNMSEETRAYLHDVLAYVQRREAAAYYALPEEQRWEHVYQKARALICRFDFGDLLDEDTGAFLGHSPEAKEMRGDLGPRAN
jgi:hypothetical protein